VGGRGSLIQVNGVRSPPTHGINCCQRKKKAGNPACNEVIKRKGSILVNAPSAALPNIPRVDV
jgi:hypothetical protein